MSQRKHWGNAKWLGLAALLACSSDDGAAANSADGAIQMPLPPLGGAGEGTPPMNQGPAPGAANSAGGEAPNAELPLTPAPTTPAPASPGAPPASEPPAAAEPLLGAPVQQPLPELVSVRQEHAVVALDGEIYVIGGFTPMVTASVEAFDPDTETWRSVASLPVTLQHANAASVNGRIYVAGFYLAGSFTNPDARVFEYDPQADAWSERSAMPAGSQRASACVATLGSKIYVFGGARAATVTDASAYDVANDSWEALPPLPEAREHCVAGEIGGTLYIASGRAGGITGFQPNAWAFDPAAQTYAPIAPIATPRGGTAGAVLGGKLYIFGGEGNPAPASFGVFTNIEAYDPVTDSWQALPAMLNPRHGFGAAATGGRIYLPGGAAAQGFGAVSSHTVVSFEAAAP